MKRFNILHAWLLSFVLFLPMQAMDIETPAMQIVSKVTAFINAPKKEKPTYLLGDLQTLVSKEINTISNYLNKDFTPDKQQWWDRISTLNDSAKKDSETIDSDLKALRSLFIEETPNFGLPFCCEQLRSILNTGKIPEEKYTRDIIKKLFAAGGGIPLTSLFDRLEEKIFPIPGQKPQFDHAKIILSIICDKNFFSQYSQKRDTILESTESPLKKRRELTDLYSRLSDLKDITGENALTFQSILKEQQEIRSVYKTLKKSSPASELTASTLQGGTINPFSQSSLGSPTMDPLSQSSLDSPTASWQDTYNDLNASFILSDDYSQELDKTAAFKKFQTASQTLIGSLTQLENQTTPEIRASLIQLLDTFSAYIYTYDLSPKKKDKPYESYRCWLLEFIKQNLETNDTFTTATIQDWLEQIKAIAGETEKRYISSGNLGESEIGVKAQIKAFKVAVAHKEKKSAPQSPKSSSSKILSPENILRKEDLKKILNTQEAELAGNAFNVAFLSTQLKTLKEYQKLLTTKETEEKNKINKLIKTTSQRIQRMTIIQPSEKNRSLKKRLTQINKTIESSEFIGIKTIKEFITELENFLPIGEYYDASQVITEKNPTVYKNLLLTLQNCVTQLAEIEKESLKTVRFVDTKYFKQLSDEISSFELVQAKDPENTQIIADIITIYKTMIQNGTNLLVREINTPDSIITNNLIETWFDQVEILRPYKEQVNDALTEAKTRAKTPPSSPQLTRVETVSTSPEIPQRPIKSEATRPLHKEVSATVRINPEDLPKLSGDTIVTNVQEIVTKFLESHQDAREIDKNTLDTLIMYANELHNRKPVIVDDILKLDSFTNIAMMINELSRCPNLQQKYDSEHSIQDKINSLSNDIWPNKELLIEQIKNHKGRFAKDSPEEIKSLMENYYFSSYAKKPQDLLFEAKLEVMNTIKERARTEAIDAINQCNNKPLFMQGRTDLSPEAITVMHAIISIANNIDHGDELKDINAIAALRNNSLLQQIEGQQSLTFAQPNDTKIINTPSGKTLWKKFEKACKKIKKRALLEYFPIPMIDNLVTTKTTEAKLYEKKMDVKALSEQKENLLKSISQENYDHLLNFATRTPEEKIYIENIDKLSEVQKQLKDLQFATQPLPMLKQLESQQQPIPEQQTSFFQSWFAQPLRNFLNWVTGNSQP